MLIFIKLTYCAFYCSHFMLTVTFEVGTIIITILLMRKQTQRSGVTSAAQSQSARKGGARLQTQVNYPLLMLLTANTLTTE